MSAPPITPGRPLRAAAIGFAVATTLFAGPTVAPASAAALTGIDLSTYVRVGRFDLPEPTRTAPPVAGSLLAQEASGVAYNPDTDSLFIAGDGSRSVTQVSKTGQLIDSMNLPTGASSQGTEFYDTEGITYIGNGQFVITEERDRQLVRFTYAAGTTLTRAAAKTVKLGTTIGNVGLEGLTYDPAGANYPGGPIGDRFIVVKEKDPLGIFQTTVDWDAGTATNASPTTVNSTNLFDPSLVGTSDLSDVYALSNVSNLTGPDAANLVIVSQEAGKVVEVDRAGVIKSSFTLINDAGNPLSIPDQTHEGVTVDSDGNVYVVSEAGGGDEDHPQLWVYSPSSAANAAPTAIALTAPTTTIAENTSTASRVKVAGVSITDDGLGTNALSVTGPDASFFEVDATGLHLKAGTTLNAATKSSYTVSVTVDDTTVGATPDATTSAYTLNVSAVTAAPASTSVAVTEVTPWGSGDGVYSADWWELTNTGTAAVDLTGWKFDDSSAAFGSAAALTGVSSLAPGESAVFIDNPAAIDPFKAAWFPGGVPAGFKIGSYTGGGIGLSTDGDQINVFDGLGNRLTGVAFGASTTGKTFDNSAALGAATGPVPAISTLSAAGTNGAFTVGTETGSPGRAAVKTSLIVSEVAPWGSSDETYAADWWELTNVSDATIDLTGFKVDDSSNAFGSGAVLNGVTTLAPGQSAVFVDGDAATVTKFTGAWFGNSIPAGLQVGFYSGAQLGLSTSGDAVNVFNAAGDRLTGVSFGAATSNFSFDNHAGLGSFSLPLPAISALSVIGQFGAFLAHDQVASPGRISSPTVGPLLSATAAVFPAQAAGTTGTGQWVTATNSGDANVTISRVAIREANDDSAGDFLLSADRCTGATLTPGQTCKVQVRFAPGRASATSTAALELHSNVPGSPTSVELTATSTGLPAGPKGDTGAAGPAGPKGDTGAAGATGPKGSDGANGSLGPKGDAGAAGPQGAAGPKGDVGPAGPAGPVGPAGPAGPKGNSGSLSLTISASKNGKSTRLRVRLTNAGPQAVQGVRVRLALPSALQPVKGTVVSVKELAAGKSTSAFLSVRLKKGAARTQSITVKFTVGGETVERKLRVTL